MKILSVQQIRDWDQFTIGEKKISSIGLMEDAASACTTWLKNKYGERAFVIFCGKGNNGGDGLAIARLLAHAGNEVSVFIAEHGKSGSPDFEANLGRIGQTGVEPIFLAEGEEIPAIAEHSVIIDAIFGSGLNRPAEGVEKMMIERINGSGNEVISIDIPSGLFADKSSRHVAVVRASHTLSFQIIKLAFLMAENAELFGELHVLDIGLNPSFLEEVKTEKQLIDETLARHLYKPRKSFAHKGTFGHALLLVGSQGKMGAAVLAARACAHTGCGLVTCHVPACGNDIVQNAIPEVMCSADQGSFALKVLPDELSKYQAIGVGPGIGKNPETTAMMGKLLAQSKKPLVVDADGLNILADNKELLTALPENSILTPHPKEFERLFGGTVDEFERMELAIAKAAEHKVIIVLKGHHTQVSTPQGESYFNNTGNAGMAKGGSGDALSGVITSLVAQGYEPANAAILGVYLHGLAGDIAAEKLGQEWMLPTDIINSIGDAFRRIKAQSTAL